MWTGTAQLADGKLLPFRFNLDLNATPPSGYFLVADEKTPIPEISRNDDTLIFRFSEYGAEMNGTWDGRSWTGKYLRHRETGTTSFDFTAAPETTETPTAGSAGADAGGLAGKHQVQFKDQERSTTLATLWNKDGLVHGTFIAPDGDYGLFVGKQSGGVVQLNRFTGWQAQAMILEERNGTWSGNLYTRNDKPRAFTLQPRADLAFTPPTDLQAKIKTPTSQFAFEGITPEGATIRSADERFKGKALIVDIMGTWCHNCLDSAPLLQELHKQYGPKGLEIVGLSFEISDDAEIAKKNLKLYRDRFGITFPLLFAGDLDDANVDKRLKSQIENFFAYPTTLFIDRQGKVQSIHSGFKGPGTGEEFKHQIEEFHRLAAELVG